LEVEFIAVHKEVPKEKATVEIFGALKEWYRDQHLAVRRCGQLKKRTQGNGGSQRKLAAACRRMAHRVIPPQHKEHGYQGSGYKGLVVEQR
jgi:hypothetical protein